RGHPDLFFAPHAERPTGTGPTGSARSEPVRGVPGRGPVPAVRPAQSRVRLLGWRVRGGTPSRRLHGAVADRRARPVGRLVAAAVTSPTRTTGATGAGAVAPGRPLHVPVLRHTPCVGWTPMSGVGSLAQRRFAVVDVETNGLSHRRDRLLQIAVITTTGDGQVLDRWSSSVRPRFGRVGPTHIHGLTARGLREAPAFAEVAPELVRRLDGAVFTAHNADFDWGFVARALRRAGYQPPDTTRLCTARLSRAVAADAASHRLADVCERHGITIARAHDA